MQKLSPIGEVIDNKFKVTELLGEGGFGAVYLADHLGLDRKVAIKFAHEYSDDDVESIRRFEREGKILATLQHENIVNCYAHGLWRNRIPYLAFEYINGETLRQRLHKNGRLPWSECLEYGIQICRALTALHNKGIVHRDLKPENLIVTSDGTIKLIDFGLVAIDGQRLTRTGTVVGTLLYVSPEQAVGHPPTNASDIYSLGCVLYHLIAGCPPFDSLFAPEILRLHVFEHPPPLSQICPDIPSGVELIISHAMQKEANRRYFSADEFAEDMQDALKGKPIVVANAAPSGKFSEVSDKHITTIGGSRRLNLSGTVLGCAIALVLTMAAGSFLFFETFTARCMINVTQLFTKPESRTNQIQSEVDWLNSLGMHKTAEQLSLDWEDKLPPNSMDRLKMLDSAITSLKSVPDSESERKRIATKSLQEMELLLEGHHDTRLLSRYLLFDAAELQGDFLGETESKRLKKLFARIEQFAVWGHRIPEWLTLVQSDLAIFGSRMPTSELSTRMFWVVLKLDGTPDAKLIEPFMTQTSRNTSESTRELCNEFARGANTAKTGNRLPLVLASVPWLKALPPQSRSEVMSFMCSAAAGEDRIDDISTFYAALKDTPPPQDRLNDWLNCLNFLHGIELFHEKKFDESFEQFSAVINSNAQEHVREAAIKLANNSAKNDPSHYESKVARLESLIANKTYPSSAIAEIYFSHTCYLIDCGRFREAVAPARKCVDRLNAFPHDWQNLHAEWLLTIAYDRAGLPSDAARELKNTDRIAHEIQPWDVEILPLLCTQGDWALKAGQTAEAEQFFARARQAYRDLQPLAKISWATLYQQKHSKAGLGRQD